MPQFIALNVLSTAAKSGRIKMICNVDDICAYWKREGAAGSVIQFLSEAYQDEDPLHHTMESPEDITSMLIQAGCTVISRADWDNSPEMAAMQQAASAKPNQKLLQHHYHETPEPTGFFAGLWHWFK